MSSTTDRSSRERGQVLVLFAGGTRRAAHRRRPRVRRRHDARRATRSAERGRRGGPGRRAVRPDRRRRGRGPPPATSRSRTASTTPIRTRSSTSTSRRSTGGTRVPGVHRGPDRGDPPVDLRRGHRTGELAGRGHGRRDERPEPDVPVRDARAEPDRVQGDRGVRRRHRRGAREHPVELERLGLRTGGPVGFSRTGGSTINVLRRRCHMPSRRHDPGPGLRPSDDLHEGAELVRAAGSAAKSAGSRQAGARRRRCIRSGTRRPPPDNCPGGTPAPKRVETEASRATSARRAACSEQGVDPVSRACIPGGLEVDRARRRT